MIKLSSSGTFKKTEDRLKRLKRGEMFRQLEMYGQKGVDALASATPVDTSLTANSWVYVVIRKNGRYTIVWKNTNIVSGIPVAILIQYGHATRNGGYVEGRDYINPALRPVFDKLAQDVWKEVRNA